MLLEAYVPVKSEGESLSNFDPEAFVNALEAVNTWRSSHGYPINTFQATLRLKLKKVDKKAIVAQRLKRMASIIEKMKRYDNMQLGRMQDIGGLRAVVGSLAKVRKLEQSYQASRFSHELANYKDYINEPKDSGYRSVHLVYRYNNPRAPEYNGLFVELQIRTRIQHAWATAVETMGTFLDHALKSSEGPEEWLRFFALTGSAFAHIEKQPPVPGFESLSELETYRRVVSEAKRLRITERLYAFAIATEHVHTDRRRGGYHLITLDIDGKSVLIKSYSAGRLEQANEDYAAVEQRIARGEQLQAVLVSAGPIENLRRAYPNYFLDTGEFIASINRMEKRLPGRH